jgi:hypothetical protein
MPLTDVLICAMLKRTPPKANPTVIMDRSAKTAAFGIQARFFILTHHMHTMLAFYLILPEEQNVLPQERPTAII